MHTYEIHLSGREEGGMFVCRACANLALKNDPNAFAYPASSTHDCELHFEGVCEDVA